MQEDSGDINVKFWYVSNDYSIKFLEYSVPNGDVKTYLDKNLSFNRDSPDLKLRIYLTEQDATDALTSWLKEEIEKLKIVLDKFKAF
jgi:hypothetical protein